MRSRLAAATLLACLVLAAWVGPESVHAERQPTVEKRPVPPELEEKQLPVDADAPPDGFTELEPLPPSRSPPAAEPPAAQSSPRGCAVIESPKGRAAPALWSLLAVGCVLRRRRGAYAIL